MSVSMARQRPPAVVLAVDEQPERAAQQVSILNVNLGFLACELLFFALVLQMRNTLGRIKVYLVPGIHRLP